MCRVRDEGESGVTPRSLAYVMGYAEAGITGRRTNQNKRWGRKVSFIFSVLSVWSPWGS